MTVNINWKFVEAKLGTDVAEEAKAQFEERLASLRAKLYTEAPVERNASPPSFEEAMEHCPYCGAWIWEGDWGNPDVWHEHPNAPTPEEIEEWKSL